jgi:DNA topoisomerase IB
MSNYRSQSRWRGYGQPMVRLKQVSSSDPGWRRLKQGRGFRYLDEHGAPLSPQDLERVRALVIPPAWRDVWICPHPRGHLQAVGVDTAGRRQYLYHPAWREARDAAKFDRVLEMASRLPAVRRRVRKALTEPGTGPDQVLAAAVRLVDLGCFRLGSDASAEENSSYGLTTLQVRHVRELPDGVVFEFVGKAGVEHAIRVDDSQVVAVVRQLRAARDETDTLLAAQVGERWVPLGPTAVNDRLRQLFRLEVTAKDMRTWHGTVTAAAALATCRPSRSAAGRQRQVRSAMVLTAQRLGNTPTVARASYVDPRVIELFEQGVTVGDYLTSVPSDPVQAQDKLDKAVVRMLTETVEAAAPAPAPRARPAARRAS